MTKAIVRKDGFIVSEDLTDLEPLQLTLKNRANSVTSSITTLATVERTWVMPDSSGTVALELVNSAGLAAALSDETGTGLAVFNNSPELINPNVTAGGAYKYNGANVITTQTALNNYFFGGAGNLTMTGISNTASGYSALLSNTAGSNNTASGVNALLSNTTGSNNTVSGVNALLSNTVGNYNTVSGFTALFSSTTGSQNTASGREVLFDLGAAQTAGTFVSGISYTIATVGTTDFTLIGAASNTVGVVFTATGVGAGTGTATPNYTNNNTAIGFNTGRGIIHGTGNTILGANVTGLAAGLTNNVILANGTGAIKGQHDGTGWTLTDPTKISAGYTVATLPAGVEGQRAYVTDATAPTFLGTLTGGGAVRCPVFRNATVWVAG